MRPDEVTSCDFHNLKQRSSTLQEYLECIIKLRARGQVIVEKSIIDAAVHGMNLGPCCEYLERHKPKTVNKLFEIIQEYCKSDRGKRRRIEEMNEQKKSRNSDRLHSKPWHTDQPKHQKAVNIVSEEKPRDSRHHSSKGRNEKKYHEERHSDEDMTSMHMGKYGEWHEDEGDQKDFPS